MKELTTEELKQLFLTVFKPRETDKVLTIIVDVPDEAVSLVVSGVEIYLPLAGMVDQAAEQERLLAELKETEGQIKRLEGLLSSPFAEKAPAAVVDKERQRLQTFKETAEKLKQQLG